MPCLPTCTCLPRAPRPAHRPAQARTTIQDVPDSLLSARALPASSQPDAVNRTAATFSNQRREMLVGMAVPRVGASGTRRTDADEVGVRDPAVCVETEP